MFHIDVEADLRTRSMAPDVLLQRAQRVPSDDHGLAHSEEPRRRAVRSDLPANADSGVAASAHESLTQRSRSASTMICAGVQAAGANEHLFDLEPLRDGLGGLGAQLVAQRVALGDAGKTIARPPGRDRRRVARSPATTAAARSQTCCCRAWWLRCPDSSKPVERRRRRDGCSGRSTATTSMPVRARVERLLHRLRKMSGKLEPRPRGRALSSRVRSAASPGSISRRASARSAISRCVSCLAPRTYRSEEKFEVVEQPAVFLDPIADDDLGVDERDTLADLLTATTSGASSAGVAQRSSPPSDAVLLAELPLRSHRP